MEKYRNTISLASLITMGVVKAGTIEDKYGNTAVLNADGSLSIYNVGEKLSLNKAAEVHNFLINNVDKKMNGWRYWYVYVDGTRYQLQNVRKVVFQVYFLNTIEKLLAEIK